MNHVSHQAESRVSANGIEIAYDSFGEPGAAPIILIMGFTMPMIIWDEDFCGQLASRDYRVIRFDNRDVGHSTWLKEAGIPDVHKLAVASLQGKTGEPPYSLLDMARDVLGLMDALAIDVAHIVGMSMGGMIAQSMAIHYPERVRTLTSLSSTMWALDPTLPPPTPEANKVLMTPMPLDRDGFIDAYVRNNQVISGPAMPNDEAFIRQRALRIFERGVTLPGAARQMAAIFASGSRREALKFLKVPTLVIHGEADPLIPAAHGIAMAQTIPGAKLHLVKGMGHDLSPTVWPEIIEVIAGHT
jgi:pimeloyl-ACP methyl ester carboxylesterase